MLERPALEDVANAAKNFALTYDMAMAGYTHPDAMEMDIARLAMKKTAGMVLATCMPMEVHTTMIDITALLATEGPSEAQVEAEARRLAEAQVLTRTARELAEDLNTLMHELAKRGFETTIDLEREQMLNAWCPMYQRMSVMVRRVMR